MTYRPTHRLRAALKLRSYCAALALFFPWGVVASQAQARPPQEPLHTSRRQNGIIFTKGAHGDLLADLYLPAGSGLRPAIVFLHGGAWKSGDRTQLQEVAVSLADAGYVGMAIDYDLTSKGDRFPLALHECERAIAWLRLHAAQYDVDPRRIAVAGSSAGGELAALLGLETRSPQESRVQATVVLNGVLDLSYVGPEAEDMIVPYLGGTCGAKQQLCRKASPVNQVHPQSPPFFVGHGTEDRIVPYSQAVRFVELLRNNGVAVTPFIATGAGHTYWKATEWYRSNIAAVSAFLAAAMLDPQNQPSDRTGSQ